MSIVVRILGFLTILAILILYFLTLSVQFDLLMEKETLLKKIKVLENTGNYLQFKSDEIAAAIVASIPENKELEKLIKEIALEYANAKIVSIFLFCFSSVFFHFKLYLNVFQFFKNSFGIYSCSSPITPLEFHNSRASLKKVLESLTESLKYNQELHAQNIALLDSVVNEQANVLATLLTTNKEYVYISEMIESAQLAGIIL